jgi:tetratricopeptide (TPR) repeat protein
MDRRTSAGGPTADAEYDAVFHRLDLFRALVEHDIHTERERAEILWQQLRPHPAERRLLLVQTETRYQIWGLYGRVLAESRNTARSDPRGGAALAELALAVAHRLHPCAYGAPRIHDFCGAALVALANALRLAADFPRCAEALRSAHEELAAGTGDPLEEAQLHSVHGSYLTDRGEIEQAVSVLQRARACSRRIGDRHGEGRTVLQQAALLGETEPQRGITLARRALALLDPAAEPHLELGAWHTLAFSLNRIGETVEAERILAAHRHRYGRTPDPTTLGRLRRLEAWIAREKGELLKAEHFFREQRALYEKHDMSFDQVLASLELAEVLTLQARTSEALAILTETYPILAAWGLDLDVLRSWILLEEGVLARAAGSRVFRDLTDLLRRRWLLR